MTPIFICCILGAAALLFFVSFRQTCRANDELLTKIYGLRSELALATEVRSNNIYAFVEESDYRYSVVLRDIGNDEPIEIVVKHFRKGDDAEFARLLADELAEHINTYYN